MSNFWLDELKITKVKECDIVGEFKKGNAVHRVKKKHLYCWTGSGKSCIANMIAHSIKKRLEYGPNFVNNCPFDGTGKKLQIITENELRQISTFIQEKI